MAKKAGITVYLHLQEPKLSDKVYDAARREIEILDCLAKIGPSKPGEIAAKIGLSPAKVGMILGKLKDVCVRYANQKWELLP